VAYCPECNMALQGNPERCYICGSKVKQEAEQGWVVVGTVDDKPFADMARETLQACEVPAVVISRSGFFGNVGLPLNPIYETKPASFEISVPAEFRDEAIDVLDATLGDKWRRKED